MNMQTTQRFLTVSFFLMIYVAGSAILRAAPASNSASTPSTTTTPTTASPTGTSNGNSSPGGGGGSTVAFPVAEGEALLDSTCANAVHLLISNMEGSNGAPKKIVLNAPITAQNVSDLNAELVAMDAIQDSVTTLRGDDRTNGYLLQLDQQEQGITTAINYLLANPPTTATTPAPAGQVAAMGAGAAGSGAEIGDQNLSTVEGAISDAVNGTVNLIKNAKSVYSNTSENGSIDSDYLNRLVLVEVGIYNKSNPGAPIQVLDLTKALGGVYAAGSTGGLRVMSGFKSLLGLCNVVTVTDAASAQKLSTDAQTLAALIKTYRPDAPQMLSGDHVTHGLTALQSMVLNATTLSTQVTALQSQLVTFINSLTGQASPVGNGPPTLSINVQPGSNLSQYATTEWMMRQLTGYYLVTGRALVDGISTSKIVRFLGEDQTSIVTAGIIEIDATPLTSGVASFAAKKQIRGYDLDRFSTDRHNAKQGRPVFGDDYFGPYFMDEQGDTTKSDTLLNSAVSVNGGSLTEPADPPPAPAGAKAKATR